MSYKSSFKKIWNSTRRCVIALITRPNTFTAGTTVVAAQVNDNENTIYNEFNGNIDNANIKAAAGIVDTKLATILTAGKVNTSALTGNITTSNVSCVTLSATNISVVTDIYTAQWADYSALTTITGWSSFTVKHIYTKKIGKTVLVSYYLTGTSNATTTSFTLPYLSASGFQLFSNPAVAEDNGGTAVAGAVQLNASTQTAICYTNMSTGTWTNSGTKSVIGQFFYETA